MRKLDDIIPPSRRKETESLSSNGPSRPSSASPKFPYKTISVVALIIAASIGILIYFSSAKVEVTPKTVAVAVQGSFTANQSTGALPYELITAQKIASQSVKSSGTKVVNSFASGTITIYNTQSKSQRLIENTRFATTAGLVFRIRAAVTVPSGSAAKPGSITAKVYADRAGDSYNVGPTSFTLPGLAGTPQASQVYARSTSAMTGGASGNVPVVLEADEAQARSALIVALAPDLSASLEEKIPAGYVLVPGSATTSYQALVPTPSAATGQVDLKEQGTITAVVFPSAALAKAIALSVTGLGYQGEPVELSSVDTLALSASGGIPEPDAPSFAFTLSGTAPLVYTIDPARIAAAVSGKTKAEAEVAVSNYPEVKRAFIILRPLWRRTLPQDPSSIEIVMVAPDAR